MARFARDSMKIVAILESTVAAGGGFSQALNAIVQMARICEDKFDFEVLTTRAENVKTVQEFGIVCTSAKVSLLDRALVLLSMNPLWRALQGRMELVGPLERLLMRRGADLVYFLTQSANSAVLQKLNYITTVFDLCHRDTPEFPEVRCFGRFQGREQHFQNNLAAATLIITESELLSERVSRRYGVDRERCLAMPMSPSPLLDNGRHVSKLAVLKKYNLDEGYFFYPAQFWAHKNHIRILEALVVLRERGHRFRVVFCGGDQGNLGHITEFVARHSLGEYVRFLGFVPVEDMRGLYEGCAAVVMPTYFGPTNLPPLETWQIGRPLIYSSHLKEQARDGAICIDPDDALQLAEALKACTQPETAAKLVEAGRLRMQEIGQQRKMSEIELTRRLHQFDGRRKCWA